MKDLPEPGAKAKAEARATKPAATRPKSLRASKKRPKSKSRAD
jgi:hypothetical protein